MKETNEMKKSINTEQNTYTILVYVGYTRTYCIREKEEKNMVIIGIMRNEFLLGNESINIKNGQILYAFVFFFWYIVRFTLAFDRHSIPHPTYLVIFFCRFLPRILYSIVLCCKV